MLTLVPVLLLAAQTVRERHGGRRTQ